MPSPERTHSSMGSADAFSDQSKPRPTPYADPSSPERFLSPSSFEGPQEVLNEDDTQRVDIKAYNDFVVPDGFDDQTPQPKRIKTVATTEATAADQTQTDEPIIGKRKKPAKVKKERKPRVETPTSAPDCAQSAEEARFRKQKNVTELMEVMKKRLEFSRPLIMASAQDKKVKKELRKSMSVLAPALSSGCGLDTRTETDADDKMLNTMYLGKYTKKIPVFPSVYTDLDNNIAAPYAFPQVELDMEAGQCVALRIRWFKSASNPDYKETTRHRARTLR
ncbi:hypothetical protein SLS61_008491 [Didymella pomorum]